MARPSARLIKDLLNPSFDQILLAKQNHGIHIALNGFVIPNCLPRFVERDSPVHSNDRTSSFCQMGQQLRVSGAKVDHGDTRCNSLQYLFHVGQDISSVISRAQTSNPGIKKLNTLCTGRDLCVQINHDGTSEFLHQDAPCALIAIHQRFRVGVGPAGSTFDRVTCERKRGARESDQRHISR